MYLPGVICGGDWAEGLGVELIRILFDMEKQVRETLAHGCRVQEHTLSSILMTGDTKPSTGSQYEGCIFVAAVSCACIGLLNC